MLTQDGDRTPSGQVLGKVLGLCFVGYVANFFFLKSVFDYYLLSCHKKLTKILLLVVVSNISFFLNLKKISTEVKPTNQRLDFNKQTLARTSTTTKVSPIS